MRPKALAKDELVKTVNDLPGWSLREGKLYKKFEFANFIAAMDFMNRAVDFIEAQNHHPEWFNVYNRVEVWLITHEVAKSPSAAITKLDTDLAKHMNTLA